MFISEAYILLYTTTIDVQIITSGELFSKAQYLCSMQEITNWFWGQHPQQKFITVITRTILHQKLEVNVVTNFHVITTSLCTSTQAK